MFCILKIFHDSFVIFKPWPQNHVFYIRKGNITFYKMDQFISIATIFVLISLRQEGHETMVYAVCPYIPITTMEFPISWNIC